MAPPKDIARSYPKRGLTADVGFRSEPKFCGDGSTDFDGSADELSTTATLSVATVPIQTFCVWVKPTTVNANRGIVVNGLSNSNDAFYLYQYLTGYGQASNTSSPGQSRNFALNSVKQDQWQFLCGVYDATDPASVSFSLYVDGVSYSDTAPLGTGAISGFFKVGRSSSGYFAGKIANVKVFDVALTQDQVRELYNNPGLTTPTGVNSSNLRRHYKLETNFNDSGADSENLTSVGSPSFTVDRPQLPRGLDLTQNAAMARVYSGRAVDFDGSADYLLADSSFSGAADFSYSAWVNLDSNSGTRTIVGENSEVTIYLYGNKIGAWNLWGTIGAGEYAEKQTTNNAPTGRWAHIGVSFTYSSNTLKLYIDGIDQPTVPSPVIGPGSTSGKFEIGARDNGGSPLQFLDGKVAGVKRFDVALTQDQIRELYHNPEQVLPTGVSASNLDRYYPLSDYNDTGGTGGRWFQDMGADGEPAEDLGSCTMAFAQPVPCPQLGLQQSATRLYFPNTTTETTLGTLSAAPGSSMSFSLWFNMQDIGTNYLFRIGSPVASFGNSINVRLSSSGSSINMYLAGTYSSGLTANFGEWNHVVIATSSSSPYWRCWVNNVEASSPTALPSALNVTATDVAIGSYIPGGSSAKGIINDVALWHTELDTSDVAALYNSGVQGMDVSTVQSANLKGWWKCDDLTTLKDYSGTGNSIAVNGTFAAASFPENASGSTIVGDFSMKRKGVSVLNFFSDANSIDSRAVIPAQDSVFPKYPDGFTVSVFFRLQKRGVFSTIYYSTDGAAANQNGVYITSANQIWFEAGDGGGSATRLRLKTTTLSLDGEWHHYAATITHGTPTTGKAYFDGVLNATDTSVTQTGSPALTDITIGDYLPTGSNEATGPIACLRFYRGPLSDNEIEQIYRSDLRLIKGLENV